MIKTYTAAGLILADIPAACRFSVEPLGGKTQAQFQAARSPDAQINGSLYNGNWAHPIGTVIYDGRMVNNAGAGFGFGVVDGVPSWGGPWARKWTSYLTGYPGLIRYGESMYWHIQDPGVFNATTRRSGVCQKGDRVYFVTSVGGMTLRLFRDTLLGLGMEQAINLDGGGSSRLLCGGKTINKPTDNRCVTNVIAAWKDKIEAPPETEETTLKATATKKQSTYTATGAAESGRYIDKGDKCDIGSITANLLIPVTYPTGSGPRQAFVRSLEDFTRG